MAEKIISIVVNFVVTGMLGYVTAMVKNYRKKNNAVEKALMTMLQSNLTNTYFVYEKFEEIPDYVYKNWLNELREYETLGGNDYVHVLASRMQDWKITRTNILKKGEL